MEIVDIKPMNPIRPGAGKSRTNLLAFTLIELLVVISIIAVLASMLIPAVLRSIEAGRSSSCLNNLRQMSVGAQNYSLDQNGRFPNFRTWLWKTPGNLASGELFKYVGHKEVYLCPTDKREIASKKRPRWATGNATPAGRGTAGNLKRDYSYPMSCGMCHAIDTALYRNPGKTMLFMEAYMATNDYSGEVGPGFGNRALAPRHSKQGNLAFADLHVEKLTTKKADSCERYLIFWFPTEKTGGPGGMNFGGGLLPGW